MAEAYREEMADCELCETSLCKHGFCRDQDCPNSKDKRDWCCQDCAEAQEQEWIENYYGASTPQTDQERLEVAYREFKQ